MRFGLRNPQVRNLLLCAGLTCLAGCKVLLSVPSGGSVTSASGAHDCSEGSSCEIEVLDTNFDDTFTAVAADGYGFGGWSDAFLHFCGGKVSDCRINSRVFAGNTKVEEFLLQDRTFFMEPVFLEWLNWEAALVSGDADPYPDAREPWEAQALDFDKDGDLDIVISYSVWPTDDQPVPMVFLANDGGGNFSEVSNALFPDGVPETIWAREMIVADFNGDGISDLFIADHGRDAEPFDLAQNTLLLGTADGLVNATENLPQLRDFSHSATYGDIDGDGDVDIFVGNYGPGAESYFLLNDGQAVFARSDLGNHLEDYNSRDESPDFQSSVDWTSCLLFDADVDGDLDLAGGGWIPSNGPFALWKNSGDGSFTESAGSVPQEPLLANDALVVSIENTDLDGDSFDDLLVMATTEFYQGARLFAFINRGDGSFTDESDQRIDTQPDLPDRWIRYIHLMDLDGDQDTDMVLEGEWEGHASYLNNGSGYFFLNRGAADLAIYDTPWNTQEPDNLVELGDFDNDGNVDLFSIWGEGEWHLYRGINTPGDFAPSGQGGN